MVLENIKSPVMRTHDSSILEDADGRGAKKNSYMGKNGEIAALPHLGSFVGRPLLMEKSIYFDGDDGEGE